MDHLVKALASDLDRHFPVLVSELQHGVFSGLRQLTGDHHRAEDLTQEAFIRAYRAMQTYPAERIKSMRLRGYVWTIALNLLRNQARAESRQPKPVRLEDAGYLPPDPPDSHAWRRRWQMLPTAQRRAVILRHVSGLSYQEISDATGRPQSTVRSDVRRGLGRLRTIIDGEDNRSIQ
ncbi:MAG: RNA polymerase sigma factor [bacterium]|nr:RNA polymerase sigma factor [Acidimicrobiia bacterium]MCY4649851.1 RNA polymerase sigma factor [bacterium]